MGETHGGKVLVMNNDIAIHKESVKLIKSQNEMVYSLTFTFDALCEALVSIYFMVVDTRDHLTEITFKYYCKLTG